MPLDLSNYALIKQREKLLLESKVYSPQSAFAAGKPSYITRNSNRDALKDCAEDLDKHLSLVQRYLQVMTGKEDLPVAYASNTLYVLERNGLRN